MGGDFRAGGDLGGGGLFGGSSSCLPRGEDRVADKLAPPGAGFFPVCVRALCVCPFLSLSLSLSLCACVCVCMPVSIDLLCCLVGIFLGLF